MTNSLRPEIRAGSAASVPPLKGTPGTAKPDSGPEKPKSYDALARGQIIFGLIVAVVFFGGFGGWAATAPLSAGAIAPGIVSPDSSRRVVQHLEGGIIRAVHVREGQQVREGDPLMTLDSIRAEATYSARREEWLRLLVTRARLDALARDAQEVVLPPELATYSTASLEEFADSQIELFAIRRNTLFQEEQILERQIEQLRNEIASINAQNDGLSTQASLLGEEIDDKSQLLEQQLINKSAVLELRRTQASIASNIAANHARIAQTEQKVEEVRLTLLQTRERFRDQVTEEATRVNNQIATLEEEMVATGDVLRRTELFSPVDGTVLNMRSQTLGGVVRPGDPILDIVPQNDELVILARLNPRDIDLVHEGLPAQVQLVPFQNRNTLPLNGEVIQVGADAEADEATQEHFYELRVLVPASEVTKHEGMYLTPGMPAEVIVVTGERTMLEYLLQPVARTVRQAFVYD